MPAKRTIKLGLIQHACPTDATRDQNLARATDMIRDAAAQGAQLIATQELFTASYFPQTQTESHFDLAELIPGPPGSPGSTTHTLRTLAKELDIEITASIFEKRAPGVYHNTSIMIDHAGQIIGQYRKMHIPDDPRFYEKYYFTPGDARSNDENGLDGFAIQQTRHATTGMLICWDQWFPEAARLTALRGAEIIFYPTAIAWHKEEADDENQRQRDAWITIQRSHAIANGIFIAAINRVGTEHDLNFWGSSFIADPGGQIIAQASTDQDEILIADCDLSLIEQTRRAWPFLRDRRIDAYQGLTQRMLDNT